MTGVRQHRGARSSKAARPASRCPASCWPTHVVAAGPTRPGRAAARLRRRTRRRAAAAEVRADGGVTPFTFYRGFAAMHAYDLGQGQHTALTTQLCGDMHLSNFGVYASPERNLRLRRQRLRRDPARSLRVGPQAAGDLVRGDGAHPRVLAVSHCGRGSARGRDLSAADRRARADEPPVGLVRPDGPGTLEALATTFAGKRGRKTLDAGLAKARGKTHARAAAKLTEMVDGQRRFRSDPPLLTPMERSSEEVAILVEIVGRYRATLVGRPSRSA